MYVVIIDGWEEATPELARRLAEVLGISAYEARQRLMGGGPVVAATLAEAEAARGLGVKLQRAGFAGFILDGDQERLVRSHFVVHSFELGEEALTVRAADGRGGAIPYGEIDLLLPGTGISGRVETQTVTGRKFSMGKTVMSGGIPMSKKVKRQEEVRTEERQELLYLRAGKRPFCVFPQHAMEYDGLGSEMKPSSERNFHHLLSELKRRGPSAIYDDRLLRRAGLVKLLGISLDPERYLPLAMEILGRGLTRRGGES